MTGFLSIPTELYSQKIYSIYVLKWYSVNCRLSLFNMLRWTTVIREDSIRLMNKSSFGTHFTVTTWGESHGKALGAVVDGCPAGLSLCEEDIQKFLDRRKPGQSRYTTARKEGDLVEILSGIFEGKTTGTPISLIVRNTDVPEITAILHFPIVPDTQIILLMPNTVFVIIEAAAALPVGKLSGVWHQVQLPPKFWKL